MNKEKIKAHYILVQLRENLEENLKTENSGEKRILENGIELLSELKVLFTIPELARKESAEQPRKSKKNSMVNGQC